MGLTRFELVAFTASKRFVELYAQLAQGASELRSLVEVTSFPARQIQTEICAVPD